MLKKERSVKVLRAEPLFLIIRLTHARKKKTKKLPNPIFSIFPERDTNSWRNGKFSPSHL